MLVTLPFFIPPILTAMAWGMLGNPQVGLLNQLYQWVTGIQCSPINVYSYGGVVWHMMQYSVAVHVPADRRRLPRHGPDP